jgi:hypothetical protein
MGVELRALVAVAMALFSIGTPTVTSSFPPCRIRQP